MTRVPCTATLLVDDERVRVTRFDFGPGAETGWHRHAHDYVITAITDCHMLLEEPGGSTRRVLVPAGSAYRRMAGVEHNVVNDGAAPMAFVEVELKVLLPQDQEPVGKLHPELPQIVHPQK